QKPFILDLLMLFDDLSDLARQLEKTVAGAKGYSSNAQLAQNLNHALDFLIEILHRLEVAEIEAKERIDLNLHRVINFVPAENIEDDGRIVQRLKRGFMWHGKLLRPEEVVAERFQ